MKLTIKEDEYAWEHMPVSFDAAVMTYADIDTSVLEFLAVPELRNLAAKVGISSPLSKTQDELITEISKRVETEMNYFECSSSSNN